MSNNTNAFEIAFGNIVRTHLAAMTTSPGERVWISDLAKHMEMDLDVVKKALWNARGNGYSLTRTDIVMKGEQAKAQASLITYLNATFDAVYAK